MAYLKTSAAAPLSDGRIQIWAIDSSGNILSRWKVTTSPTSPWTSWTSFQGLSSAVISISAAPLPDGRIQLFATDSNGKMWSCWKVTTSSKSPWTTWTAF